jgi:hypothetical protein
MPIRIIEDKKYKVPSVKCGVTQKKMKEIFITKDIYKMYGKNNFNKKEKVQLEKMISMIEDKLNKEGYTIHKKLGAGTLAIVFNLAAPAHIKNKVVLHVSLINKKDYKHERLMDNIISKSDYSIKLHRILSLGYIKFIGEGERKTPHVLCAKVITHVSKIKKKNICTHTSRFLNICKYKANSFILDSDMANPENWMKCQNNLVTIDHNRARYLKQHKDFVSDFKDTVEIESSLFRSRRPLVSIPKYMKILKKFNQIEKKQLIYIMNIHDNLFEELPLCSKNSTLTKYSRKELNNIINKGKSKISSKYAWDRNYSKRVIDVILWLRNE